MHKLMYTNTSTWVNPFIPGCVGASEGGHFVGKQHEEILAAEDPIIFLWTEQ